MIPLSWYLTLGAMLFVIGIVGVLVRRNVIVLLMAIELIMNAVNINMVAFSYYLSSIEGQIFTIFIITVAAAQAALGLALIVLIYRNHGTINIDAMNRMRW